MIPILPWIGGAYEGGDCNTIMHDIWGYLIVKYDLHSMIDVGCGYGHSLEFFSKLGVSCVGYDGDPNAIEGGKHRGYMVLHDFAQGPAVTKSTFDLGWSAEFLEHVREKYMANYMTLLQRCKRICVTHAEPGQIGHHHVNCQDDRYWIEKFASFGFEHNSSETKLLRQTDRWKTAWGRRTLMLFDNTKL